MILIETGRRLASGWLTLDPTTKHEAHTGHCVHAPLPTTMIHHVFLSNPQKSTRPKSVAGVLVTRRHPDREVDIANKNEITLERCRSRSC